MGGKNETKIQDKVEKSSAQFSSGNQAVRIHESGGCVHFHVDAENLKASMPVATWFSAWERLSTQIPSIFRFYDTEKKTVLTVSTDLVNDKVEAEVGIVSHEVGPTFTALNKFTNA